MTVRVEAPARLHLGMLDVVGGEARRFGGLGVAVGRPSTIVEATPASKLAAEGPEAERALAVGLWTFALGGLVVEGGVRPGAQRAAPLLARHPMPVEWRCVLAIPSAEPGLSGIAEEEAFAGLRPPTELSALIAQLVLTSLLPALAERDLPEFGAAVTRLQRLVGEAFAPVQGGVFHPRAAPLVDALLAGGAAGAGQSSWGPAVYGVVGDEAAGRALAERMEDEMGGAGTVEVVPFANDGARITTHRESAVAEGSAR